MHGIHVVRVERGGVAVPIDVGFEHEHRTGLFSSRTGVDQNDVVILIHEGEREIVTADTEIDDIHTGGKLTAAELPDDLDAEPVVAQEDVPDPGDEYSRRRRRRRE